MRLTLCVSIALSIACAALPAQAQTRPARTDPNCTYQACALGLALVWNGLEVTRGDAQHHAATLDFFMPQDISSTFADDPEARDVARDAYNIRKVGAALTDAGIILLGTGLARSLFQREFDGLSTALTIAGGASLAAGVPVQMTANAALSRAVWLFNRRFAR